jgi:hypothetical protein
MDHDDKGKICVIKGKNDQLCDYHQLLKAEDEKLLGG